MSKKKETEETKVPDEEYINAEGQIVNLTQKLAQLNRESDIAIVQFNKLKDSLLEFDTLSKSVEAMEKKRVKDKEDELNFQARINSLQREYIEAQKQLALNEQVYPTRHQNIDNLKYVLGINDSVDNDKYLLPKKFAQGIRDQIQAYYPSIFSKDNIGEPTIQTILTGLSDTRLSDYQSQAKSESMSKYNDIYKEFVTAAKNGTLGESGYTAARALRTQMNRWTDPETLAAYQKKLESDQAKRDTELSDKLGISKDKHLQFGNKFSFDKLMTITTGAGTAYESKINKNKKRISELNEKSALGLSSEESAELDFLNKDTAGLESKLAGAKSATTMITAVQATVNAIKKGFRDINNIFKQTVGISFSIKDNFQDILKDVGSMLSTTSGVATYDTSTSYFTNASARQQQIKYGLSSSSNWAFTQTKGLLGINNDTDIAFMNDNQRTVFTEYMQKYTAMYNEMSANGTLTKIQEMQLELKSFKQEVAADLLSFVADNRDEILEAAQAIIGITKFIITAMTTIINWLPGLHTSSIDYLGYSSTASKASLSGLTLNTTVNVNGSADSTTLANDIAEASKSSLVQAMLGKNL